MNAARILVVEDEAVVSMHLEQRLNALGYQVVGAARTSEKAMVLAEEQRPDLVLMDIRIQGPVDGIDTAQHLRDRFRLPVVFLTAFAEDATLDRAKLAEPYGFILKPFEDRELKTVIEIALYKHRTDREIGRLNRLYAVLSQVNQTIVRLSSRPELLTAICRIAVEHGEFKLAWVGWLDPATRAVQPAAHWGDDFGCLPQLGVSAADEPQGQGPAGTAVREGKTSVRNDVLKDMRMAPWQDAAASLGVRALAAVPIYHQGEVRGAFSVWSAEPDFFQEKEISLLEEVGRDLSFALDNLEREAQRKRAEQALRESEMTLRTLIDHIPDSIYVRDTSNHFVLANVAAARRMGAVVPAELVGKTDADFFAAAQAAEFAAADRRVFAGCSLINYEEEMVLPSGDRRAILSTKVPLRDAQGTVTGLIGIGRDITAWKLAEQALRESEENYRQIFNAVNDAIFIHDADTMAILDVNEAMLRLYGFDREEVRRLTPAEGSLGCSPFSAIEVRQWMTKATAEGPQVFEWRARKKSGELFWVEIALKAAVVNGQRRMLAQVRDITDRKRDEEAKARLEAQLRQAQKMEAIGTLAGGIAHDFNNILGAMIGYTDLARRACQSDPQVAEDLENVLQACERAKNLVRQILSFSRQTKQARKPLDLSVVVREGLSLLRSTLPATIEIGGHIAAELPQVLADPTQIHQVLMNLCTNAAHALRGQVGRLEVSLEPFQAREEFVALRPDMRPGLYVRLSVSDTGQGMDEATLKRAFEPFFTTKGPGEGTGLGLSVVHGIVRDHDGAIYVRSQPAKGTTFDLYFPASSAEPSQPEIAPVQPVGGHQERILLVDDEPDLCATTERVLRQLGYAPTTQADPLAALALFRAQPDQFDLVITDLTMPGMTGVDLATAMLAVRPHLPVILASGFSGAYTRETVRQLGLRDLIYKPVDRVQLSQAIQLALREKSAPDQA